MKTLDLAGYGLKIFGYKLFRRFGFPKMGPENVVFSVTNLCNSRCLTCSIWTKYQGRTALASREMTTKQWLKTWQSLGRLTFCTFTGGEPFLRKDALELLNGLYRFCQPKILNICHNGTMPERFERVLTAFLKKTDSQTSITINLSLDGIGSDHDKIRGFPGNWQKLVKTITVVKKLQKSYSHLNLGLHTVVSKWNVAKVPRIIDYVQANFQPDNLFMEPAEERNELGTTGWGIMPPKKDLARVFGVYTSGRNHTPLISLVKKIYLDKYLKGGGLPCYAAFNYSQITTNGNIWICCMVGDRRPLGNLHEVDFDFKKIWFSPKVNKLREMVKRKAFKECHDCYLACAANTSIPQNIILTSRYLLKKLVGR